MNKQRELQKKQAQLRTSRRRRLLYLGAGLVVALALLTLGLGIVFARAEVGNGATAMAGCSPIQTTPDLGRTHLNPGQSYNYGGNNPPTSGPHDPDPMSPGVYDNPISETREVHSLEHGYVIIHYNGIPADQVQQLGSIARQDPRKVIVAPFPGMTDKISLTAWDHIQTCGGVNVQLIRSFIAEFRDKGPEQTPM
ncbi:MAG: DUF3105 domain-containing protein [Rudaea sp.]